MNVFEKTMLAILYQNKNLIHYEVAFDNREDASHMIFRIYLSEQEYLCVTEDENGQCYLRELKWYRSYNTPSTQVSFINRSIFKKYRDKSPHGRLMYSCHVPLTVFGKWLQDFHPNASLYDKVAAYYNGNHASALI